MGTLSIGKWGVLEIGLKVLWDSPVEWSPIISFHGNSGFGYCVTAESDVT